MPAYEGRSIANIGSSLVRAYGRPGRGMPPLPPLASEIDPFGAGGATGPTVLLVVDGLGWNEYWRWRTGGAGTVPPGWHRARPLTSVFPSTTAAALTSLSTGAAPAQHGVVGYHQYLPRFGVVANMLRMGRVGEDRSETLVGPGFRPSQVSAVPTVFRRGVRGCVLSHDAFFGTGFSRTIYDGAPYVPYATAAEMAIGLREILSSHRPPDVTYAYWSELDTGLHRRGPLGELFALELERLAMMVRSVAARLPARRRRAITLLVTGDHGLVPYDRSRALDLRRAPEIVRGMRHPLSGDLRAGLLAVRPGLESSVRRALARRLPSGSRVLGRAEAVALGLFGPPPFHPELTARLGDLVVLIPSPAGITQSDQRVVRRRPPLGAHGGLEPSELLVPLISGALDESV